MCNPAAILAGGGAVLGAISTYQQYQAASEEAKYKADLAKRNAELSERDKAVIAEQAEIQKRSLRFGASQLKGEGRVQFAAAGFKLGAGGSVYDWERDVESGLSRDIALVEYNKQLGLYQKDVEKTGLLAEASLLKAQSKNLKKQGYFAAGASLLGGSSQTAQLI